MLTLTLTPIPIHSLLTSCCYVRDVRRALVLFLGYLAMLYLNFPPQPLVCGDASTGFPEYNQVQTITLTNPIFRADNRLLRCLEGFHSPCSMHLQADSEMAQMCGGISCLFLPLYISIMLSEQMGRFLQGFMTTQKRPEQVCNEREECERHHANPGASTCCILKTVAGAASVHHVSRVDVYELPIVFVPPQALILPPSALFPTASLLSCRNIRD